MAPLEPSESATIREANRAESPKAIAGAQPRGPEGRARAKKRSPRMNPDLPLQTYRGLLQSLAALSRTTVSVGGSTFTRCAKPTPLQAEAFKCLGLPLP